jgi:imidazolonepropionase-like amidohydrolase
MTPWQILEAATIAPARFSGLGKDFGTVEVGKHADSS